MTDEELSMRLTEAMDARIQRAEAGGAKLPNRNDTQPLQQKQAGPAARSAGAEPVQIKAETAGRRFWRSAAAAVLALALLGGGGLLLSRLLDRTGPTRSPADTSAPAPTGESAVVSEPAQTELSSEPEQLESCPNEIWVYTDEFLTMDRSLQPNLYAARSFSERSTLAMLIDDYDVICPDAQGRYVRNQSVCASIERTPNEDGSVTLCFTLCQGLRYSDGTPISAVDFLVNALLDFSPQMAGSSYEFRQSAACFAGADAYLRGETDTISGLRLLGEDCYSITVPAEAAEDYFLLARLSLRPVRAELFGAEPVVEAETVRLRYSSPEGPDLERGRGSVDSRVGAGPYVIESYDAEADRATLRINPYYAGNFEGRKPSVERLVLERLGYERDISALPEETIKYFTRIVDGDMLMRYLREVEAGTLKAAPYSRDGCGYLLFQCDMGPTQFRAVRQAIACCIDRERFAEEFCQGFGTVTHGPYAESSWEYQTNAEALARELDSYAFDPARAVALLEADGWVLAEDGSPYVSGLRWKELSPEQAGSYPYNVTLADGRVLMPLRIDRMRAAGGSVTDLLESYTAENQAMLDAGIQVKTAELAFDELLDCLYRVDWTLGEGCTWRYDSGETRTGPSCFCLTGLAVAYTPIFDYSADFVEANSSFHYDCDSELARLSRQLRQAQDDERYAALWKDFMLEWNRELPYLPLYVNSYYDFMDPRILGLTPSSRWPFARAVLYAAVEGAQ